MYGFKRVFICYIDEKGDYSERTVDVEREYTTRAGARMISGYCHKAKAARTFRADRIKYRGEELPPCNQKVASEAS